MIIRGILDKSLSKQTCIRGFARIKELARVSKANKEYQRELIDKQKTVISNFLTEETYLFFPEVILSLKLKYDYTKTGAKKESPLTLIDSKKPFKSNIDGLSIKVIEKKNNKSFDTSSRDEVRIAELEFDETSLNNLIRQEKHPFHRVDGNHRLSAADQLDGDRINMMDVPFCIVLFEEITDQVFDPKLNSMVLKTSKDYEKFEKVVFYNINSKTIPLTLEQNLKVLIDDNINFSNEELEKIFGGKHPVKTRELTQKASHEIFIGLKHLLKDNYRTYYNEIFSKLLLDEYDESIVVDKVFESLQAVDQIYKSNQKLKSNNCLGLLTAFVYYHIEDNSAKFELFKNWVLNHHIFDIEEATAGSIINIFKKIVEDDVKVFVAMPYFEGNPTIVKDYNEIYSNAINEIRTNYGVKISLFPIMSNKGETQDQIQDIINKIKQCSIFIADISGNNANVMYEAGWARALKKHVLYFRESNSEKPKSDYSNDTYHEYQDSARSVTLKKIAIDNIVEILNKNYGLVLKS